MYSKAYAPIQLLLVSSGAGRWWYMYNAGHFPGWLRRQMVNSANFTFCTIESLTNVPQLVRSVS